MRFLLDNNISIRLEGLLARSGHDAVHVRQLGLGSAADPEVLRAARGAERILVSADTDFSTILSLEHASSPSLILWRSQVHRRAEQMAALLIANLPAVADDLDAGAVVVITDDAIRVRRLPILPA